MKKAWYLYLVDDFVYIYLFTLISFGTALPMFYKLADPVMPLFLVWGLLILGYKVLIQRKPIFGEHLLLGLFLLSYLVTMILHRENFVDNLKTLLWTACFFYIFLDVFPKDQPLENRNRFHKWTDLVFVITFAAGILSCCMYLTQYLHYVDMPYNPQQPQGLWGNRLVGVYREANFGAMFGMISMGLSIFNLCSGQRWKNGTSQTWWCNFSLSSGPCPGGLW